MLKKKTHAAINIIWYFGGILPGCSIKYAVLASILDNNYTNSFEKNYK